MHGQIMTSRKAAWLRGAQIDIRRFSGLKIGLDFGLFLLYL